MTPADILIPGGVGASAFIAVLASARVIVQRREIRSLHRQIADLWRIRATGSARGEPCREIADCWAAPGQADATSDRTSAEITLIDPDGGRRHG